MSASLGGLVVEMGGVGVLGKIVVIFLVVGVFSLFVPQQLAEAAERIVGFTKDKLGFADPSIADFGVKLAGDGKNLAVGYHLLGAKSKVTRVEFSRQYKKYLNDGWGERYIYSDEPGITEDVHNRVEDSEGGDILLADNDAKAEAAGMHLFTLEVFYTTNDGSDAVSSSYELKLYDESYLNLYPGGGIEGCKFATHTSIGRHECDPYSEKREALKALTTPAGKDKRDRVIKAMADVKVSSSCKYVTVYEAGDLFFPEKALNGCTPEEMHNVYRIVGGSAYLVALVTNELEDTLKFKGFIKMPSIGVGGSGGESD